MNPRIPRIVLAALLLAVVPQFAIAQTVTVSSSGALKQAKKKPQPTPTPGPLIDPDGTWNSDTSGNWSDTTKWTSVPPSNVPDAGGTANINFNITATRTVTINTTSRTIGILNIGDTNNTDSYTVATSGGGTLIFDNLQLSGANTQLNELLNSKGDLISAPVVLNSSLDITNASPNTLTISGGITSGTGGPKTITTSTGLATLSGVIGNGSGTVGIVQNGAGTLTLSGNNTFTGGIVIKSGTVSASGGSSNSLGGSGTGAITLGDSSGSANATLTGATNPYANPINVAAGSSGTLTISHTGNGSANFTGAVTLNNNLTLLATGTGNVKLTGGVTGTGNLTLNNNSNSTNIFFDTTLVNNTGTITNSGTGTGPSTINSKLGGNVTQLIQNSATSTLRLNMSTNTAFVGSVAVNAGTLELDTTSALNSANTVSIASGAKMDINGQNETIAGLGTGSGTVTNTGAARTLTLGGSGAYNFGGNITANTLANMSITKTGLGTQVLSGVSNYTGDTQILQGDLRFDSGGNVNSSTIRLGDTSGSSIAVLSLGVGSGNNVGSALEARAGTTGIRVLRSLATSGTNIYSGAITLNAGLTLESTSNGAISSGTLLLQGGSVDVKTNTLTVDTQIYNSGTLNGANGVNGQGAVTINEVLGSSLATGGSLVKDGSNTLILQGTSNTYTGTSAGTLNASGTQIKDGVLGIYGDGSLGLAPTSAANNIFFAASALTSPTNTPTLQDTSTNITLGATRNINVASGVTGSFDSNGNLFTINGIINGAGNIAKIGVGTVTLNGNNTYGGTTTVRAGTLLVNGNQSTATGLVTVNGGGTLGGSGTIGGAVTVNSGGNLSPGASPGTLRTGSLTLNSSSNYLVDLNNTTAGSGYDQTIVSGNVNLLDLSLTGLPNLVLNIGGTLAVNDKFFIVLNDGIDPVTGTFAQGATITAGGDTFLINYADNGDAGTIGNDISLTVTAVPEPSTWIGGSLALAALAFSQRRRFARARAK